MISLWRCLCWEGHRSTGSSDRGGAGDDQHERMVFPFLPQRSPVPGHLSAPQSGWPWAGCGAAERDRPHAAPAHTGSPRRHCMRACSRAAVPVCWWPVQGQAQPPWRPALPVLPVARPGLMGTAALNRTGQPACSGGGSFCCLSSQPRSSHH